MVVPTNTEGIQMHQKELFHEDRGPLDDSEERRSWPNVDENLINSYRKCEQLPYHDAIILSKQLYAICFQQGQLLSKLPGSREQMVSWFYDPSFVKGHYIYRTISFIKNSRSEYWQRLNNNDQYPGFKLLQKNMKPLTVVGSNTPQIHKSLIRSMVMRPEAIGKLQRIALSATNDARIKTEIRHAISLINAIQTCFLNSFSPVCLSTLKSMRIFGDDFEEYAQEAKLGILDALHRYDPFRRACFSVSCRWWVKSRIKSLLKSRSLVEQRFCPMGSTEVESGAYFDSGFILDSAIKAIIELESASTLEKYIYIERGLNGKSFTEIDNALQKGSGYSRRIFPKIQPAMQLVVERTMEMYRS